MAKKRSSPARKRSTSASKRKSAPQKTRMKSKGAEAVSLKRLYEEIGRKIGELQKIETGDDRVRLAIKQLEDCRIEFSRLCFPSMDFPFRAAPLG